MALSVRELGRAFGAGTLNVSTGDVQAGEKLFAISDRDAGTLAGMTAPSGWSEVDAANNDPDGLKLWVKDDLTGEAEPATLAFVIPGGSDGAVFLCAVNASAGTPVSMAGAAGAGSGTAVTAPSLDAEVDPSLLVSVWLRITSGTGTTVTAPGGTPLWENVRSGDGNFGCRTATWELVDDGTTGTRVATASTSGQWFAGSFLFHEVGGEVEPAEGSAAPAIGLTLAASGSRGSAGSATLALSVQLQATGYRASTSTGAAALSLGLAAVGSRDSTGAAAPAVGLRLAASGSRRSSGTANLSLATTLAASGEAFDPGTFTPGVLQARTVAPTLAATGVSSTLSAAAAGADLVGR